MYFLPFFYPLDLPSVANALPSERYLFSRAHATLSVTLLVGLSVIRPLVTLLKFSPGSYLNRITAGPGYPYATDVMYEALFYFLRKMVIFTFYHHFRY